MVTPAVASAAEVVLTFLESVGRRSEAELYLRLFQKLPKESFALIAPGAPVVRHGAGTLVEQIRFLADLGLVPAIVLGLFDPETTAPAAERLGKRLSAAGLDAPRHAVGEPGLVEQLRTELRAEKVPVVAYPAREGVGLDQRLAELSGIARELDTRKMVLLRRRGGIGVRGRRLELEPGRFLPVFEGRLSVINLRTDREPLALGKALGKREQELVELAASLIGESSSLFVSVASPLNLLRELFTVKGAGTLIKRGTSVERHADYSNLSIERLKDLFEQSFSRSLAPGFFEQQPLAVYVEATYRGAAIVSQQPPGPYLSKFAVESAAQGEGIGNDIWQALVHDFPRLFWRARPENPIHAWYQSVCDGMVRRAEWNVYFRGVAPSEIPGVVELAESLPPDFAPAKPVGSPEA